MIERTELSQTLGQAMAAALGTGPSRNSLISQRVALLEFASELDRRRRRGWVRWPVLAAGFSALVVLGLVLWQSLEHSPLQATFAGTQVAEQHELVAEESKTRDLSFSDGSELLLEPKARAVVALMSKERAELRLKNGKISASIRKGTGRTWTLAAGPYSVRVVGTRFSVDWNSQRQMLKVEVTEGRVRVSGGDLPEQGVTLDAGARLERHSGSLVARSDAASNSLPLAPSSEVNGERPSTAQAGNSVAPQLTPGQRSEASASKADPPSATASASGEGGFRSLAAKGKYGEALELAEKQGFDQLIGSVPENDLVLLANAARFSGNSQRARQALLRLRQRFPGRPGAELGALYLARVAEDLDHHPAQAAKWLRVFLSESPGGDLAAGARANLMSLLLRMGDDAGARAVAEDYVRYHPSGPHIGQARALISPGHPD